MSKTVRIPLPEPILGHKAPITELVLREPTYDDYIECGGEPYTVGESEEGTRFASENHDVIWAYAERCIVEPEERLLLGKAPWSVAREVRKAILGFFREAVAVTATSATSPTTSPSS